VEYLIALRLVEAELNEATKKFGPFFDNHQGYAVILEEMDELWDVIKSKDGTNEELKSEAKQVAAMALRFLVDRCE